MRRLNCHYYCVQIGIQSHICSLPSHTYYVRSLWSHKLSAAGAMKKKSIIYAFIIAFNQHLIIANTFNTLYLCSYRAATLLIVNLLLMTCVLHNDKQLYIRGQQSINIADHHVDDGDD